MCAAKSELNPVCSESRGFPGIGTDNPNAVVVGLAPEHFHYEMMNRAFR